MHIQLTRQILFTPPGRDIVHQALCTALNTSNHPILIHDDMGKSTTSFLISLIRRYQRWSLTGIFAEGDMYAGQAGGSEGDGIGEVGREVCLQLPIEGRESWTEVERLECEECIHTEVGRFASCISQHRW